MSKRPNPHRGRVQAEKKSPITVIVRKMTIATLKAVSYQQFFSDCPTVSQSLPGRLALAVAAADTRVSVSGPDRLQSADATLST